MIDWYSILEQPITWGEFFSWLPEEWQNKVRNIPLSYVFFDKQKDFEDVKNYTTAGLFSPIQKLLMVYLASCGFWKGVNNWHPKPEIELPRLLSVYFKESCIVTAFNKEHNDPNKDGNGRNALKRDYLTFLARLTPYVVDLYPFVEYAKNAQFQNDLKRITELRAFKNGIEHARVVEFRFNNQGELSRINISKQEGKSMKYLHLERERYTNFFDSIMSPQLNYDSHTSYTVERGEDDFKSIISDLSNRINAILPDERKSDPRANIRLLAEQCGELYAFLMGNKFIGTEQNPHAARFFNNRSPTAESRAVDWIYELLNLAGQFPDSIKDKERFLLYIKSVLPR